MTPHEARRIPLKLIADFLTPVLCPSCGTKLAYRPLTGRGYCYRENRTWNSLDYLVAGGMTLPEAITHIERINK